MNKVPNFNEMERTLQTVAYEMQFFNMSLQGASDLYAHHTRRSACLSGRGRAAVDPVAWPARLAG